MTHGPAPAEIFDALNSIAQCDCGHLTEMIVQGPGGFMRHCVWCFPANRRWWCIDGMLFDDGWHLSRELLDYVAPTKRLDELTSRPDVAPIVSSNAALPDEWMRRFVSIAPRRLARPPFPADSLITHEELLRITPHGYQDFWANGSSEAAWVTWLVLAPDQPLTDVFAWEKASERIPLKEMGLKPGPWRRHQAVPPWIASA